MKLKENYKRDIQRTMLEMIKDIDKLCRENDIEYYIAYGSCLGAIRYKGFIPWDDDFDIMMTDEYYFKFLDICKKKLDKNKYYVQTPDKEENYYLSFSKIRNIQTTLIEENNSDIDIIYGVYIDVFPLVGVPENKLKRSILKINRAFMLSSNINVINKRLLSKTFNIILKIFGKENVLKYTTKQCFKYKCKNCSNVVSICDGDGFEINEIQKSILGKPKYVDFEDTKLPIPEDVNKYLTKIYGDYMRIPTKEEIKAKEHTPYFLDLNLPCSEYIRKKKILFVIWSFTSGGGAEKILSTLVNSLDKKKYAIDILEYWHSSVNNEHIDNNVTLLPPVVDPVIDNKFIRILKLLSLYIKPMSIRKKYIKKDYDVEISYNYMIPTFIIRKTGKTIAWMHGDIYDLLNNKLKFYYQKRALKNVNYIVTISKETYNSVIDLYPEYKEKTIIINNSYNFESIINKSKEFNIKKSNQLKELLYLGRFDSNKNPMYLIEVMKKLREQGKKCKLVFMGYGELKEKMEKKIVEYNLSKLISIIDYQKNPYPYIKSADIIVGCSHSEGFPTVLVEGMIFGKPFISTKVGGVEELSDDGKCGFIASDIDDYANKISTLILSNNTYETMSKNCKKYVKKYSCNTQSKVVDRLIEDVLKGEGK